MKKALFFLLAIFALGFAASGFLVWRSTQGIEPAILEAKYTTAADRFVDVGGLRVRVREEGPADAPAIVMLHGFLVSLESFDAWSEALSSDYRVIRFDLAGHGLTGPDPEKRYSPVERAAFVGDVMDAIGVGRAVIAGNSLGGLAAWRFAAENPERVDALVLVAPGAFPTNGVSDEPVAPPPALIAFLRMAPEAGVKKGLEAIYSDDSKITPKRMEAMRDMMRRRGNGQAFVDSLAEFTLSDPTTQLTRLGTPTLIQWGEDDVVIPVEQGERMAAAMPRSQLIRYPAVGHVPQEEAPEETVADAKAFLDSLGLTN